MHSSKFLLICCHTLEVPKLRGRQLFTLKFPRLLKFCCGHVQKCLSCHGTQLARSPAPSDPTNSAFLHLHPTRPRGRAADRSQNAESGCSAKRGGSSAAAFESSSVRAFTLDVGKLGFTPSCARGDQNPRPRREAGAVLGESVSPPSPLKLFHPTRVNHSFATAAENVSERDASRAYGPRGRRQGRFRCHFPPPRSFWVLCPGQTLKWSFRSTRGKGLPRCRSMGCRGGWRHPPLGRQCHRNLGAPLQLLLPGSPQGLATAEFLNDSSPQRSRTPPLLNNDPARRFKRVRRPSRCASQPPRSPTCHRWPVPTAAPLPGGRDARDAACPLFPWSRRSAITARCSYCPSDKWLEENGELGFFFQGFWRMSCVFLLNVHLSG